MGKYFSKHAEIEAVFYEEDKSNVEEVLAFGGEAVADADEEGSIMVTTNNGEVELLPGHWLIEGVSDFYPCDVDSFEALWRKKPDLVIFNRTAVLESSDADTFAEEFISCVEQNPKIATDKNAVRSWFATAMQNSISFDREKRAGDQQLIADLTLSDPTDQPE